MKVIKNYLDIENPTKNSFVTIGNFDGIHRGHANILSRVVSEAQKNSGTSIVMTFRPHPHMALRQNTKVELINTYEEKIDLLQSLNLDQVLEQPFNRDFSELTPEYFFHEILIKRLNVKELVVGYDFAFGKSRVGNLELLKNYAQKAAVNMVVCEPHKVDGMVCSSTKIREMLSLGQVEEASHLLGRPFFYRGLILKGDGRGKTIGFPTANMKVDADKIRVKPGVYATKVNLLGSQESFYCGVTNVGFRPTFYNTTSELSIETYILDFSKDIYGEKIQISLMKRIRDEIKFSDVSALVGQIHKDVETARFFFKT